MYIIKHRVFFYILSGILLIASMGSLIFNKWNYSIEFTGGALLELSYKDKPPMEDIKTALNKLGWGTIQVQAAGDKSVLIRTKDLSEKERQQLITTASLGNMTEIVRFSSYGPSIGAELRSNSIWAIFTVLIGIMLYVAYAFRQVSKPVSSWMYGFITVIALAHDVIIPAGIYIMLSAHNIGVQIDVLFVTALLTVLGFSVHDTIVVFDRTRENLRIGEKESFETTVGKSVSQTFTRSINTSLTVLIVIGALYLFGGETTRYFAFTLGIGVIIGTYSSIFIGSPLLVTMANLMDKRKR